MRLKRASAGWFAITRSGVTASVMHRNRSVQSPVERSRYSAGFAPRLFVAAPYTSQANGSSASTNRTGLANGCSSAFAAFISVVLLQVHAGVHLTDQLFVA